MLIFAAIKVNNGTDSGFSPDYPITQEGCEIKPCAIGRNCRCWKDRDVRHREGEGISTIRHPAKDFESAEHTDIIKKSFDGKFTKL
jgi:hypothetical protein